MNSKKRFLAIMAAVAVIAASITTGAAIAAVLQKSMGSDTFNDIPEGHYADEAIGWAVKNGITQGISKDEFGPDRNLTRAQTMAFLYRYHNYLTDDGTTPPPTTTVPTVYTTYEDAYNAAEKWKNDILERVSRASSASLIDSAWKQVTIEIAAKESEWSGYYPDADAAAQAASLHARTGGNALIRQQLSRIPENQFYAAIAANALAQAARGAAEVATTLTSAAAPAAWAQAATQLVGDAVAGHEFSTWQGDPYIACSGCTVGNRVDESRWDLRYWVNDHADAAFQAYARIAS